MSCMLLFLQHTIESKDVVAFSKLNYSLIKTVGICVLTESVYRFSVCYVGVVTWTALYVSKWKINNKTFRKQM